MAYAINHIHLKAEDPKRSADWWVAAFGFTIESDAVRSYGDRFIVCRSSNGIQVNVSGPRTDQTLGPGDANPHEGLEHFGFDSEGLEADIERLTGLGAELLEGPNESPGVRICFLRAPDNVRIELIQRNAAP